MHIKKILIIFRSDGWGCLSDDTWKEKKQKVKIETKGKSVCNSFNYVTYTTHSRAGSVGTVLKSVPRSILSIIPPYIFHSLNNNKKKIESKGKIC